MRPVEVWFSSEKRRCLLNLIFIRTQLGIREINHFKVNNMFALIFMSNLNEYWNKYVFRNWQRNNGDFRAYCCYKVGLKRI